jgi:hypothetical protein
MVIQLLVATACLLFVLSLPIAKTALGAALRRWAYFAFLAAFMPSLLYGILRESEFFRGPWTIGRIAEELLTILIVAAIAYVVLAFRKRTAAGAKKQPKRIITKQPVDPPGRQPDFLHMLRDQLRGDSAVEDDRE